MQLPLSGCIWYIQTTDTLTGFFLDLPHNLNLFSPPQNFVLCFLVHKVLTFYIEGTLKCKCPNFFAKALIFSFSVTFLRGGTLPVFLYNLYLNDLSSWFIFFQIH